MSAIGLSLAFAALDELRERLDAVAVTATFVTAHGLVQIASGNDGCAISVNGVPVPMEDAA